MKKLSVCMLFLLLGCVCCGIHAQDIQLAGYVEDEFLKKGLSDVKVSVLTTDSVVVVEKASGVGVSSLSGLKTLYVASVKPVKATYLIHAELPGYTEAWTRVTVSDTSQKKVDFATLLLRRVMDQKLGEATVRATRVKMYYKGDTLVYNADAFQLPDGSMLDALIRQLPGVKLNEAGEIFVNGRKVDELLLGSHSFMRGNKSVLMENLPYYTVKDIKVYDKQTDMSEALGYDVEPRKFVMDVNLKREYSKGYIANAEGGVGTQKRWLARAFLLGYTDRLRLSFYGNLNNVNETRNIGETGYWTPANMPQSLTTTRSGMGEVAQLHKDFQQTLYLDYKSTSDLTDMRMRNEEFLPGRTIVSQSRNTGNSGFRYLNGAHYFMWKKSFYIDIQTLFHHSTSDGTSQWKSDRWDDSLTVSQRTDGLREGSIFYILNSSSVAFNLDKEKQNYLQGGWSLHYRKEQSEGAERHLTERFSLPLRELRYNSSDRNLKNLDGGLNVYYRKTFANNLGILVQDKFSFLNKSIHDYLYHPDSLLLPSQADALTAITDWNNSYDSRERMINNTVYLSFFRKGYYKPSPAFPFNLSYNKYCVNISLPVNMRELDYRRGVLDTLVRQRGFPFNVSLECREVWNGDKCKMWYGGSYSTDNAPIYDLVTYRDDSRPLVVKLGNPDLKGTSVSKLYVRYEDKSGKNMQQFNANASFNYHHRSVAQSVMYDPLSGVYTYRPMNIGGSYEVDGKFGISRAISRAQCWTWQTELKGSYWHSVDHAMLSGETASRRNTVNTTTVEDDLWLQYRKNSLYVKAAGNVSWRHSEGRMQDFSTLDALDFRYGLNAGYTLPRINTTLAMDANVYSRRGYGSADLNTDHFILNASLSQSFLKGKLIARVEGFDLLHQLSNTQYSVNAQGRVETWYRSLPRYVMFHLVYHWNKAPKKK